MNREPIYIASFLLSVLLVSWIAGTKATYWYLLLVFLGVLLVNVGKYKINITTPEILQ
jgi:hypothetical protein